ncbi:uncharacterized protein K460DRAFT_41258 [Cucurbitaria berberidis CBS 394.84]|uniref:Uncharacterized protein n=1 Tax=Cucurbitaria berberidis CBS 394.84 TaxID=1168544 RepID=A0A9P4LDE1_9PLEO|nr:uncharacterized protein K460DRAFT_41258 [Cucurbitaria berberidis CBS 394.84]KAF1851781.1 hypothetical protein K460DRAFT_41258 [Cucurbitaria berberidis CBS 394.84]
MSHLSARNAPSAMCWLWDCSLLYRRLLCRGAGFAGFLACPFGGRLLCRGGRFTWFITCPFGGSPRCRSVGVGSPSPRPSRRTFVIVHIICGGTATGSVSCSCDDAGGFGRHYVVNCDEEIVCLGYRLC